MARKSRKGKTIGRPPRHGGYSLLTRGTLPEKRKYIGHYLTAVREGLVHDLAANEEELSTAQRVLIDRVITFLGVIRLIEEYAREHGVLDNRGRLTSGLTAHYLSFNRHIKDYLALLGLKRIRPSEPSLAEVMREFDEKKATDGSGEEQAAAEKGSQVGVIDGGQAQGEGSGTGSSSEGKGQKGGNE
jgi:hypothetical protein